jgi:hypothetical protein
MISPRLRFALFSPVGLAAAILVGTSGTLCAQLASMRSSEHADSQVVLSDARRYQYDFEEVRRALLPPGEDPGRGWCDERIGRFCYRYSPYGSMPREPDGIRAARARLLGRLESAAQRLPGDGWIAGQRVRYLLEQNRVEAALAVSTGCRATRWWCESLEGFTRHQSGDYQAADSVFALALSDMSAEERCRWIDLSLFVAEKSYRSLSCEDRVAANDWIWWLARPLFALPGNDLRTEHYSREVMVRLLKDTDWVYGLSWDWDMAELVLRYGAPTAWSRPWQDLWSPSAPPVLGHERSPAFWFFPSPSPRPGQGLTARASWDLSPMRPPARYAPPYADAFGVIPHLQLARFRRAQRTLTVGVFSVLGDTIFGGRIPTVTLGAGLDPATPLAVGSATESGNGVATVETDWVPRVLSLEAHSAEASRVARLRVVAGEEAPAAPGLAVSDLLLFLPAPDGTLPDSLEAALDRALATTSLPQARIGLFWEAYGLPDSDASPEVEIGIVRHSSKGELPPLGRWECLPQGKKLVALRGSQPVHPVGDFLAQSVVLDLGSIKPGRYTIGLRVAADSNQSACASREIELR